MKVYWTDRAVANLQAVHDYIARLRATHRRPINTSIRADWDVSIRGTQRARIRSRRHPRSYRRCVSHNLRHQVRPDRYISCHSQFAQNPFGRVTIRSNNPGGCASLRCQHRARFDFHSSAAQCDHLRLIDYHMTAQVIRHRAIDLDRHKFA